MSEILSHPYARYVIPAALALIWGYRLFKKSSTTSTGVVVAYRNAANSTLSALQNFSIALDAVTTAFWEVDNNVLSFTHRGKRPSAFAHYMKGWGITTREGYLGMRDYFLSSGRRTYFAGIYPIFKTIPAESQREAVVQAFGENERALKMLERFSKHKVIDYLKSEGIIQFDSDIEVGSLGWDIANLVGQARRAFTANLISEQEAWETIDHATQMALSSFNSWEEFSRSQLIGFCLDFYKGPNDGYRKEFLAAYRVIRDDQKSPWNTIPWPS